MLRSPVRAAPFRLSSFVWESQPGRYALTVVAQGTAKLVQSGEAAWLDDPGHDPGYDESQVAVARSNLLAPFKPRVDVIVIGRAYAPPGGDADRIVARVRIGDFAKAVSIMGDRLWVRDAGRWGSSPPRMFSQMSLTPERALRSAENPIGIDPAQIPVEGRLAMPNLEPVAGSYSAVIGPIPPSAPSRMGLLSPGARMWLHAFEVGQRAGPVPEGFPFAFFNVAPGDQQLVEVAPGAAVILENLHPMHPMFTSRLPLKTPRIVAIDPSTGQRLDVATRLDTIWLDGDRETATMTYRGTGEVSRPDLPVPVSIELEAPLPAKRPTLTSVQLLMTQQGAPPMNPSALPFSGAQATRPVGFPAWLPPADVATGPAGFGYAQPQARGIPRDEPTSQLQPGSYPPPPPPLEEGRPRERAITAEIAVDNEATGLPFDAPTQGGWDHPTTSELDAKTPPLPPDTAPPPPPDDGAHLPFSARPGALASPPLGGLLPPPLGAPFAPPAMVPPPAHVSTPPALAPKGEAGPIPDIGETLAPVLPSEPPPESVEDAQTPPTTTTPAAPFRIAVGLTRSEAPQASQPDDSQTTADVASPATEADAGPDEPRFDPTPAAPRAAVRTELTLEETARVRAALTQKDADRAAILESWGLLDEVWTRLEKDHLRSIDEGVQSGSNERLDTYDDAYLEALGEMRSPLDERAYARLAVARETGQLAQVLDELVLSRAELMRVDRVWRRRLGDDKDLAERVEDEKERLRNE